MKRRKIHIIAVYAPTLQTCERDTGKRDIVVAAGDFNSKVGSQQQTDDKGCVGLYGKGKRNSSGEMLADPCTRKDLCITNTFFQHKLDHRTTWIAPMRSFITHDGTERRNSIRN